MHLINFNELDPTTALWGTEVLLCPFYKQENSGTDNCNGVMDRHGKKTRNSMPTYYFTFSRSKNVWKSVEQNALLSLLALEGFACCSDEIWHESEDGDHPVLFPLILLYLSAPLYAKKKKSFNLKRKVLCNEKKPFNLGMSTLEDSEKADKLCS